MLDRRTVDGGSPFAANVPCKTGLDYPRTRGFEDQANCFHLPYAGRTAVLPRSGKHIFKVGR